MQLTGKCKEDFFNYTVKSEIAFNSHSQKHKNKLMIDFFKSNNIFMTFRKAKLGGCMLYFSNEFEGVGTGWNLLDIQEKSICIANKIYNEKLTHQKIN